MVGAAILSGIVGGSMTVGSAEMGYAEGMFGIWQSLGTSIAMIIMAFVTCPIFMRLRARHSITTIPGSLIYAYGPKLAPVMGFFGFVAVYFTVIAQYKAFCVLLQNTIDMSMVVAAVLALILFVLFVIFGGMKSATLGGFIKMILLYIMFISIMVVILSRFGGWNAFLDSADAIFTNPNWRSPLSRGVGSSLGYGLSFSFGMICTQVYVQAMLSAKDPIAARNGCIVAAVLCLPVGWVCSNAGIYMHLVHPEVAATDALPVFVKTYFSPVIAGLFMGAMLLNTLVSASGLIMSCASSFFTDFWCNVVKKERDSKQMIRGNRVLVFAVAASVFILIIANVTDLIMTFVNVSSQIRASTVLVPLLVAGYYPGRKATEAAIMSVICGGVGVLAWFFAGNPFGFSSLYFGLLVALISFLIGQAIFAKKYEAIDLTH